MTWLSASLLVMALVALLVFLERKSHGIVPQARTDLIAGLLTLREINAQLDVDVLRSRNGLNNNYDPLQGGYAAAAQLGEKLETDIVAAGLEVPDALSQLRASFEQKFADIDDFKAANAIRLNSLRYLPTLVGTLEQNPQVSASLRIQANRVAAGLFRTNLLIDADASATRQELAEIMKAVEGLPPETELAQLLQGFQTHSETILRQSAQEIELLATLAAVPVSARIDALEAVLEQDFARREAVAARYGNFLAIYSGLLLLVLFYIGVRLVRLYGQLARINLALNDANEHLEQHVEERTRDLNNALAELKASEAHLIQSEKMASLGQMVAGVAHEINTPLGYVHGIVELLRDMIGSAFTPYYERSRALLERLNNPESAAALETMDASLLAELKPALDNGLYGLDQIREIVLNLKNFSRLDRGQHTLMRVEESIDSALMLAKNLTKHRKIIKHYSDTTPQIYCAPSQINQVMLNLITNAVQATREEDGTVTINTRMKDENTVAVKISDNGTGIPEEVVGKIFDPFFTTKEIGKGTGLGLSIAYKIITQHQGSIRVFSKPGIGTVFSIELPVDSSVPQQEEASAVPDDDMLLLEDD
ncbi:MAG: hypothetical protein LBS89_06235 [Zoogloeaceae bacterium]|nr:hypothetical protein [Zoogloeaceae bacterium]